MTEREHLEAVWRMTRRKPEGLNFPEMPDELKYLWEWFVTISNAGEVNFQTIESFQRMMMVSLEPSEVSMLLDFDLCYIKVTNERRNSPVVQHGEPPKPSRKTKRR